MKTITKTCEGLVAQFKSLERNFQTEMASNNRKLESKIGKLTRENEDLKTKVETITKTCQNIKLTRDNQNLETNLVPKGSITIWSGSPNSIPKSWQLCDGRNGTPNLSGKFVVGDGGGFEKGESGGRLKHNHSTYIYGGRIRSEQMPPHVHNASNGSKFGLSSGLSLWLKGVEGNTKIPFPGVEGNARWYSTSHNVGAYSELHEHKGRVNDRSHLPPYYVLCYIMKI